MKDKLNRLDAILHELQLDEYLNEDSLPKIGEARGLVNELVKNCSIPVVRHSSEMIVEEYVYKNEFRFQRTQKHGIWFVTYQNHLITFGQYRHDLEEWIDSNYA
jgi:hypothetical protein